MRLPLMLTVVIGLLQALAARARLHGRRRCRNFV
jgi:hypothetical protein